MGKPNAYQKNFILKKLIPFIMRERGRGFAMKPWRDELLVAGSKRSYDGITRTIPKCGTVACIGGSCAHLGVEPTRDIFSFLNPETTLYYPTFWPEKYKKLFKKAKTTQTVAKIACNLLRDVCKHGTALWEE